MLACCNALKAVSLFDVPRPGAFSDSWREVPRLPADVCAVAFSRTGRTLAVGGANGDVQMLEVPPKGPARFLDAPLQVGGAVIYMSFAPDGRSLLVGRVLPEAKGKITVWHVASKTLLASLDAPDFVGYFHAAAWLPDGKLLVQASSRQIRIHNLKTAATRLLPGQAPWGVASLAFAPDGRSLYLGTINPLDFIRTNYQPKLPLLSRSLQIQPHYQCKADVADAVRVWDMDRLTPGTRLPGAESLCLTGVIALSADGRLLAAGGADGSVWLWDLAGRRLLTRLFISDQARTYSAEVETLFALWPSKPEYWQYSEAVRSLAFSPNGRWLAAAGDHGTVTLWDTNGWQTRHVPSDSRSIVWLGFGPDSLLAIASAGQVRLFDPETAKVRTTLGAVHDAPILCGAFDAAGRILVTGTEEQTIRVWDLSEATQKSVLTGHTNKVAAVAFSPDGKTLASGDWSGEVILWSVATLQEVASLEGHRYPIRCLAFSPNGQTLASGVEVCPGEGHVLLWRAPHFAPLQR